MSNTSTPASSSDRSSDRTHGRRDVLRGAAVAAAGMVGVGAFGASARADEVPDTSTKVDIHEVDGRLYVGHHPIQPLSPTERSFDNIDGTPTMYIRSGDGVRRRATFRCRNAFYNELVLWVRRLRFFSGETGYPGLSFITSAGAYVNKAGQHGNGTAIDIDEVGWTDGRISRMIGLDWNGSDNARRKRYYAVDCTLRSSFRWSLDWTYNTAHHDHIHSDFGGLPVILGTGSGSDVGFIQGLCNEFTGAGLAVDRSWGPLTQAAFTNARQRLGTTNGNPHTQTWAYQEFLNAATRRAMAGQNF